MNDPWIETYTGRKFFPLNPRARDLCIEDIAHALAMTCRYNGHCSEFYSVAQHSCIVSDLCEERWKMAGLMHDAAEAYLGDVVSPVKPFCWFEGGGRFALHEDILLCAIHDSGVADMMKYLQQPEPVKKVDRAVLMYEHYYLMPNVQTWDRKPTKLSERLIETLPPLKCWTWKKSEREFLARYRGD